MSVQNILQYAICPRCKRIRTRCKCKDRSTKVEICSDKSTKKVRSSSQLDKLISIIREKKVLARKELTEYGFSSGGSLTRLLRELEGKGIIRMEEEKIGAVKKVKIIYTGK